MEQELLKRLQLTEEGILYEIDRFCDKYDIKYSLYAGTAIGAVRHKGFIPWDDDIDIYMERNEFERFLKLWEKSKNPNYYLQNPHDPECTINHAKIRKNNTSFFCKGERNDRHNGIWVDIFAFDRIPKNRIKRFKILFIAKLRLIYTRGYPVTNRGAFLNIVSRILLSIPKKWQKKLRFWSDKYVAKYADTDRDYDLMSLSSPEELAYVYPKELNNSFIKVPYDNYSFSLTSAYDEMLTINYGNYMELPPESERVCKHNPESLKFE